VGAALTAAIGLGLAALGIRWLFKPTAERALVALENQGWFSTTEYKPKQGQKVRRGTIAGLLVIALAGIYTLHSHHTLRRGAPDWQLNVPFTGVVLVENPGDVADHLPADLPTRPGPDGVARPAIDRYALRTINDSYANPRAYIKLTDAGGAESLRGKEGQVIPRPEFDQAVAELRQEFEAEVANVRDENKRAQLQEEFERNRLPQGEPPQPATGTVQFRSVTLLPSVQYTVPLLLLALSLWLSWRVVHLPVFADFLIATEAELNKVSWPTRKRLVQDTIVVLTTVVLMASYLLVVDLVWKEVLSSWPIQVLQLPADQTEANTSVEQKPW
jgi:preprotein translocase SecE subunit